MGKASVAGAMGREEITPIDVHHLGVLKLSHFEIFLLRNS